MKFKKVIIFVLGFFMVKVQANPATTPRIYSVPVTQTEHEPVLDGVISLSDFDKDQKGLVVATGQDVVDSLTEKKAKLVELREDLSSIKDLMQSQIQQSHIEYMLGFVSGLVDGENPGSKFETIINNDLSAYGVSVDFSPTKDNLLKVLEDYETMVKTQKEGFVAFYVDKAIARVKTALGDAGENIPVLAALYEKQSKLRTGRALSSLLADITRIQTPADRESSVDSFFRTYFPKDDIDVPSDQMADVGSAINYVQSRYAQLTSVENVFTKDKEACLFNVCGVWNHLHYSENLSKNPLSTFGGFVLGVADSAQTVKINALEYDIYFSDKWRLPLTLYSAEIIESNEIDAEETSRTKLLDSEMGTLNLSVSAISKIRWGEFCKFSSAYGCYLPIQMGVRALKLPQPDGAAENTKDEFAFGGYFKLGFNTLFPIMPRGDASTIAGRMALSAHYVFYRQNGANLETLFPEVLDGEGNPLLTGNSYEALNINAIFTITDKITIAAKYFDGKGNGEALDSVTSFEFIYSVN